jgi:CO/xanthine dehydrogenase Mo-binding subunit
MVAEEVGLPLSGVTVATGDTETAPFSIITAGSMTTRSMGKAVYRACQDVKEQICRRGAAKLGVERDEVEYAAGRVCLRKTPKEVVSISDLVKEDYMSPFAGPITGTGAGEMMAEGTPVFAVQVTDVELDGETGKVTVLSSVVGQDTGVAVNPTLVEGQMQGAVAQGIGWALFEGYLFRDGVMENATFLDYRMPTAADVPPIETLLVEVNSGVEPYGIRGVGEPPIVPGPAAMANAIMSATGVRLKELPMTPEAILNALKSKGK